MNFVRHLTLKIKYIFDVNGLGMALERARIINISNIILKLGGKNNNKFILKDISVITSTIVKCNEFELHYT